MSGRAQVEVQLNVAQIDRMCETAADLLADGVPEGQIRDWMTTQLARGITIRRLALAHDRDVMP